MCATPTLKIKGKLIPPNGDANLARGLNGWVPYLYILNWFRERLYKTGIENRVLIIKSETASGKSTLLPSEIYREFISQQKFGPGIICTQPRVLTTIENVNEILKHYSGMFQRGISIGWSSKYDKLKPKSYGLLSATIGTLEQQLILLTDDKISEMYKFIIIDEAHERDISTDMSIYMIKNMLTRNKDKITCPFIVLMSASFDPNDFLKYFNVDSITNFIWCTGATSEICEMWEWNNENIITNYIESAADVVRLILKNNADDDPARGDILIFMPGRAESVKLSRMLMSINKECAKNGQNTFSIIIIDGNAVQIQNEEYRKLISIPVNEHIQQIENIKYIPNRRIIISTNVSETGLTLDNLKYVIDSGYNREIEYNPALNIQALLTKPAPISRIQQRRGRVGRKFPGVFYPLYTRKIYSKLPAQFPQILKNNITPVMLCIINEQLKSKYLMGNNDLSFLSEDIDMLTVPTSDSVNSAIEQLYSIGFVSPISPKWSPDLSSVENKELVKKIGITTMGYIAVRINTLQPEYVRIILAAYSWECSIIDVITMISYIKIEPRAFLYKSTLEKKRASIDWSSIYKLGLSSIISSENNTLYKVRLLIADEFIDGIILFNAIKSIINSCEPRETINLLKNWCIKTNLLYDSVMKFLRLRDTVIEQFLSLGINPFLFNESSLSSISKDMFTNLITKLKHCIYDGLRNNILIRIGEIYQTNNGLIVATPALFHKEENISIKYKDVTNIKPRAMVYSSLSLKSDVIVANYISVLDGYVAYDMNFLI